MPVCGVSCIARAQPHCVVNYGCVGVQFVPARTDEQFYDNMVSSVAIITYFL